MSDHSFPPDRLQFYNTFGRHAVLSAVDAIGDLVHGVTGSSCDDALRERIEGIIVGAWHEHSNQMEESFKAGALPDPYEYLVPTARICSAIQDSVGTSVTDALGRSIADEVNRALLNLTEALSNIYRDSLLDLGFSPNDPRLRRPE